MQQTEFLIKNLTEQLKKLGLEVLSAKCDGYAEPAQIQGSKPDVICWDSQNEIYHLGLVVDSKTVSSDLIKEKINVFLNIVMGTGSSEGKKLPFYLGVPKEEKQTISEKLNNDYILTSKENFQTIGV